MSVSHTDLDALSASHDIISLGMAADEVRRAHHGTSTTFLRAAEVDVAPGAAVVVPPAAGEVRIVGTPSGLSAALQRVTEVAAVASGKPLAGFSLSDLEELASRESVTLRHLLEELQSVGLEIVSEAPFDRLRDPRRSIEEVNIAGLMLSRLTLHQLPSDDPRALYKRVAQVQREVGVIRGFAPLPRRINPAVPTTGYDDVRHVALARLFLERIPSIQVDWALYGPKLAQVALTVGADDLDAVSAIDDLSEGRRRAPLEEVRRNILAAGLEPVERDGRFHRIG